MRFTKEVDDVKGVELEFKGGLKQAFTRFWMEQEGEGEEAHMVQKHEKMKQGKKILSYKDTVCSLPEVIQPGDYTVKFSMLLPDDLPSSMMFKGKGKEKSKAKVKFFIKAKIVQNDGDDLMKFKQVLMIREKAVKLKEDNVISETSEIKTWCCCSQGKSTMSAEFNKNVFTPQENAEGEIKIDNSECGVGVSKVSFSIEQVIKQKIGGHKNTEVKTIIHREIDGPDANEGDFKKEMELDLSKIKYEVADEKKKKGKMKKISDEDKFMMASLQPACHTKKFSCDYFLCVRTEYDGCVCCVDLPDARMKMTIVPLVNPECFGFKAGDDWNPTELGEFNIDLAHDPDSD